MAEWLYEEGIGENRAILVEDGAILEAQIELPDSGLRAGAVASGPLAVHVPGRRGLVTVSGEPVLVEPLPSGLSEGRTVRVLILREAVPEAGRPKPAKGRITEEPEQGAPSLLQRIGSPRPLCSVGPDPFEAAGWSELIEEAASGEIPFPGGALRLSLTPAMTLFDVDGALPPAELAVAGAAAAARAIRRFGIGGSIGIDLPTLASKEERRAPADAVDAILPQPFERTAVNGFGFLQIVRRRERSSLPELLQADPVGAAARALLRRAERATGHGPRRIAAAPAVVRRIEANPDWLARLSARIGAQIELQGDAGLTTWAGHVQSSHI